jgi:ribosomal protein S18 acetylase RimI-like enzyme
MVILRAGSSVPSHPLKPEKTADEQIPVTLLLDWPPNQPHRAEVAKLMTRPSHRGRGVAAALMRAAEAAAVQRARTLLVLDTATEGGAAGLYERLGWSLAGEIPDFALKPHGGLTGTLIYWKRIGAKQAE